MSELKVKSKKYNDADILEVENFEAEVGKLSYTKAQVDSKLGDKLDKTGGTITGDLAVSGNLSVTGSINGEENPSIKPIYCHPITITNVVNLSFNIRLTMLIFNNSETPFTKSSLDTYIKSIPQARFLASGSYRKIGENGFYMANAFVYYNPSDPSNPLNLIGIDSDGGDHTSATNAIDFSAVLGDSGTTLYDGVNKIN